MTTGESNGFVRHTLEIACKEGKYKIEYKNLTFQWFNEGVEFEYTLEDCYPAMQKVKGLNIHKKFVIRATNKMD